MLAHHLGRMTRDISQPGTNFLNCLCPCVRRQGFDMLFEDDFPGFTKYVRIQSSSEILFFTKKNLSYLS